MPIRIGSDAASVKLGASDAEAVYLGAALIWQKPPSAPALQEFTVYAGSGNGGDTGYYTTIYGSISSEPLPGHTLTEFATRNSGYFQIAFNGNCLDLVQDYQPVIDGVTLGSFISAWAFDGSTTGATWNSTGAMTEGQQYDITWVVIGS